MKKILIPTDFTVSSLNLVLDAIEQSNSQKVQILLVHGVELSSSISDLLFFSEHKLLAELNNEEFESAVHILYNKHQSKIDSIQIDLLYSMNLNYLNNYLTVNNIKEIYLPSTDVFVPVHKRSLNIIPALRKTCIPHQNLEWVKLTEVGQNRIADLFFRNIQIEKQ